MSSATLTINSRNYGAWSLRGWLMCRFSGLDFRVEEADANDPSQRDELLLMSPSFLVPCLMVDDLEIWDTLAIAEYLAERHPGLWPADGAARAWARSICAEMHGGFQARAPTSSGQSPGWRSARYSQMASESQTTSPSCSRHGTRPAGSRAKRSALPASAWSETRCSVKGRPASRSTSQGRSDQEE